MMFIVPYVSPDYLFWKCSLHAVYVKLGQIWNYCTFRAVSSIASAVTALPNPSILDSPPPSFPLPLIPPPAFLLHSTAAPPAPHISVSHTGATACRCEAEPNSGNPR